MGSQIGNSKSHFLTNHKRMEFLFHRSCVEVVVLMGSSKLVKPVVSSSIVYNLLSQINATHTYFQVTNVVMNGKAGASSMNEDLSRYPSEFVLENSQVQRVCSHPQEPEWVTNIKKGVISSFQSAILPEGSSLGFNVTEVHS